jgi:3-oxoacyl-[acyl-carrier-protein] synthase III
VIWDNIFINSIEAYLPQRVPLSDLECTETIARANSDFETVAKSDQPGYVMAGLAAEKALKKSDHADDSLSAIVYANTFCSADHMASACYLQRLLRQREALAFELHATSNGGIAGLEVVARLLSSDPGLSAGLLSATSRVPDGSDRWMGGTLNGDGAVATVLSKRSGFARLIVSQRSSNPEFEVLNRRSAATRSDSSGTGYTEMGFAPVIDSIAQEISAVVSVTLAEANTTMQHISHVILPAFPLPVLHEIYLDRNSIPVTKTCWSELRRNGHVGPCDQLLGLAYLTDTQRLTPGELVLMIGTGLGFQFSCLLLEVV